MFHAVGLNAMAATETRRDCFEKSTRLSRELAMAEVVKIVEVVEVVGLLMGRGPAARGGFLFRAIPVIG